MPSKGGRPLNNMGQMLGKILNIQMLCDDPKCAISYN